MKYLVVIFTLLAVSCNIPLKDYNCKSPEFNSDTAYSYIVKQVDFGPRVPGSAAHDSCALFIANKLEQSGAQVKLQKGQVKRFDSTELSITNIIAGFYPEKKDRILLFTHWDTRFYSDYEVDSLKHKPVLGANDGASGVALLLEVARHLAEQEPQVGVDMIFFDAEDQGAPLDKGKFSEFDWGLGSQLWAESLKRKPKYLYGVGVDMVAARGAKFAIEDISLSNYGFLVKRIWEMASTMGYDTLFIDTRTGPLINEHLFLFRDLGLRSVMIVENRGRKHHYGGYWHTQQDNLDIIDKSVLGAVGEVVMCIVYSEK